MKEYIIAVDELDKEVGKIEKMEAHHKGVLHRAFSILVFNSKNQLLLQKRNIKKYHSPGLWTNTCCSHPRYGEKLEEAIYRRLKEEMGFTCELKEIFSFIYKVELEKDLFENEFDHVFIGKYDGEIIANEDEVDAFKWADISEIKNDIFNKPELYTYWFKCLINKTENMLKDVL
ncbi:isopentenyl-diphosphate Delta-isomerase [Clostridium saccharoperbutylacetonicum]|uniref:isopentenyl-diphosphate Delta-isomerase n=1 Tax=Clostridium saccharoperbutylacetonicum TaxID=36745 RepID=UPI0009840199|nr:isopentenyl-diphosphate Delta-isomerase [Clostridium saccharoperbutylacetonicum]AQR96256.1 isopentenyl-diphosphate delta-isomerase [Clostridium saccharoperbutylacetonicum]NSB32129.1 isopentenyl-diphosphate delta-isomerase [Clostridium saccharoperbutylacetonicum]